MNRLEILLNELETKIPSFGTINKNVSAATVGWQIEHILLAINAIINALETSNEKQYKSNFKLMRVVVFTLRKIPRGKAKAPKSVQPSEYLNVETLNNHFFKTGQTIKKLETLQPNCYFNHPFFGNLNVKSTVKFLEIHTKHHLDIISDILKK